MFGKVYFKYLAIFMKKKLFIQQIV